MTDRQLLALMVAELYPAVVRWKWNMNRERRLDYTVKLARDILTRTGFYPDVLDKLPS